MPIRKSSNASQAIHHPSDKSRTINKSQGSWNKRKTTHSTKTKNYLSNKKNHVKKSTDQKSILQRKADQIRGTVNYLKHPSLSKEYDDMTDFRDPNPFDYAWLLTKRAVLKLHQLIKGTNTHQEKWFLPLFGNYKKQQQRNIKLLLKAQPSDNDLKTIKRLVINAKRKLPGQDQASLEKKEWLDAFLLRAMNDRYKIKSESTFEKIKKDIQNFFTF